MKILLAPSETKSKGGTAPFRIDDLFAKELNEARANLANAYTDELKDTTKAELMFGLKKADEIAYYQNVALHSLGTKAVMRYTGVAFDYLDYQSLADRAQQYIDEHVLIFSNLFGVIKASDILPEYRLSQGAKVGIIEVDKYYKQAITGILNEYLADQDILDIRAGYYDRFYIPNKNYTTLKFLKDGKVVSHWAKAYRGKVLRECAKNDIQNIKDFLALNIESLQIIELQTKKNKTEAIYEIGI